MQGLEIDPAFKGSGRSWRRRRRLRRAKVATAWVAVLGGAAFATWFWLLRAPPVEEFVQLEGAAEQDVVLEAAASDAFLDLRGEPMIIVLPDDASGGLRTVVSDVEIHPLRAPRGSRLQLLSDRLLDEADKVRLTLPSSSADLAAFQSRRSGLVRMNALVEEQGQGEVAAGELVQLEEGEGSWGALLEGEEQDSQSSYVDTVIENTTTIVPTVSPDRRMALFRDKVVNLEKATDLAAVLAEEKIDPEEVTRTLSHVERLSVDFDVEPDTVTKLRAGSVVALRQTSERSGAIILQMSIYSPDRHLMSLAQHRPGAYISAADPWFTKRLLAQADRASSAREARGEVRLKDAIYGAALRNGLAPDMVGELMVMLSKAHDLDGLAGSEDRLELVYRNEGRGTLASKLLYAGVATGGKTLRCYVVREQKGEGFRCFDPDAKRSYSQSRGGLIAGLIIPVNGTKTSSFGLRKHPVLKQMRKHNGVDWGAPTGTPVVAAAAGKVTVAGNGGSYGNVVYIAHAGGVETRYAHLHGFAAGLAVGQQVAAGDLIGYVGTTGRSTGPHLHFEVRINGTAVDPLGVVGRSSGTNGGAVEALVNRIIQVESAGNAQAKNSRSSATGLGQFISSTWLRMMRDYRPDLVANLSRQQLLDLRFDPALSREMVTNLARENESFLRARGHQVTAGRLYLAHFLGPAGANTALKANPEATVLDVMGAAVVNANPFLKGKTVRWMTDWSDRKMNSVSGRAAVAAPPPPPVPPEVKAFVKNVTQLFSNN